MTSIAIKTTTNHSNLDRVQPTVNKTSRITKIALAAISGAAIGLAMGVLFCSNPIFLTAGCLFGANISVALAILLTRPSLSIPSNITPIDTTSLDPIIEPLPPLKHLLTPEAVINNPDLLQDNENYYLTVVKEYTQGGFLKEIEVDTTNYETGEDIKFFILHVFPHNSDWVLKEINDKPHEKKSHKIQDQVYLKTNVNSQKTDSTYIDLIQNIKNGTYIEPSKLIKFKNKAIDQDDLYRSFSTLSYLFANNNFEEFFKGYQDCFVSLVRADSLPGSGWKFHVSSSVKNANKIANIVVPFLYHYKIPSKITCNLKFLTFLNSTKTQSGKFITIYTRNYSEARNTALRLNDLLIQHKLDKLEEKVSILGDAKIGESGLVFIRYGKIRPRNDRDGFIASLPNSNKKTKDSRYFPLPERIFELTRNELVIDKYPFEEINMTWKFPGTKLVVNLSNHLMNRNGLIELITPKNLKNYVKTTNQEKVEVFKETYTEICNHLVEYNSNNCCVVDPMQKEMFDWIDAHAQQASSSEAVNI